MVAQLTPYPDVDRVRQALGPELVGLYLYGSLVTGDYTPGVSDVDLLAATRTDVDETAFDRLDEAHRALARAHPPWEGRIEIAYLSQEGLRTYRAQETRMAVISPGEPFHYKPAGSGWLINWWLVRERGMTLYGPDPRRLIAPISQEEFLAMVRDHARRWLVWVEDERSRKAQSYARLTLCRAWYAAVNGEQVSKRRAAVWAQRQLPEEAPLIEQALAWREGADDPGIDHGATFAETVRFVHDMVDLVEAALHGR
jgi:hypothetical protein